MQNEHPKIKVLYILNVTGGGAMLSLIDMLTEMKNNVTPILIMRDDTKIEDKFADLNITYYKLRFSTDYVKIGTADASRQAYDMVQSYEAALQLLPIIKKENIQLIHINSSVSYFAAIAANMAGVPYVWHIRELVEEQFRCEFLNEKLKIDLYKKADRLIAISDYVKRSYLKKYGLTTVKIYNGLNINKYRVNINCRNDFRNVFLVAANITPEKGQWDAIRATEILLQRGFFDVKLIVAGDTGSNYVWALKKYVEKKKLERNISILPFGDDLSNVRKQASYAITSSQNEALGRVTIEAMLAGNFAIGAKSGGTTEIIGENEERGFLYELHNAEQLADTMIRAIQCPKEIKMRIVQEAQQYAEYTFHSKNFCKHLLELYEGVLASYIPKYPKDFLAKLEEQYQLLKNVKNNTPSTDECQKISAAWLLTLKWLEIKQKGHNFDEYFRKHNFYSIAIYGMAALGCRLYDELENSDICIRYLLDRNPNGMENILEFASLEGQLLEVDAIVVTVAGAEKQIVNEIKGKGYKRVIGLSDIMTYFEWDIFASD